VVGSGEGVGEIVWLAVEVDVGVEEGLGSITGVGVGVSGVMVVDGVCV
jgi:hypothetical protein